MNDDYNNFKIYSLEHLQQLPRKLKKNKKIIMDVQGTKYDLIRNVAKKFDWQQIEKQDKNNNQWNIKWYDQYVQEDDLRKMLPFQKINHFPNSQSLGKKNNLGKYLHKLQMIFPNDYNYFPKTWTLPYQIEQLRNFYQNKEIDKSHKVFIAKPEASCQGRGIFLFKKLQDIENVDHMVVQQYITNPYLIDGLKFDIRLYVLVKNLDPLKIFLYKEGLVRFATEPFKYPKNKNLDNIFMHLTNYSVNKKNKKFKQNHKVQDKEQGHKRSFSSIIKILQEQGNDVDLLMKRIRAIMVKTLASVQPMMAHAYNSSRPKGENLELCFEVLGFDIMIDSDMKPWLIEVNHTPSFQTDSQLDFIIKENLILDTMILLKIKSKDKKVYNDLKQNHISSNISKQIMFQCDRSQEKVQAWENINLNGYMRVYPTFPLEDSLLDVHNFIDGAKKIWDAWAGPKNKTIQLNIKNNVKQTINHINNNKFDQQQRQLYKNKRPPSANQSTNSTFQNSTRPPSALYQRQIQAQTPQYQNQEFKIKFFNDDSIYPNNLINNQNQDLVKQEKKNDIDQFKTIQNFLTSTNTLYNNYLSNLSQIQNKRNQENRQLNIQKKKQINNRFQAPILEFQEQNKQNFRIEGYKLKQEIEIIDEDKIFIPCKKEIQKYIYKPKKVMDVAMLNQLNKNFINVDSNQFMNE